MKRTPNDKIECLLAASRRLKALDRAVFVLMESRKAIREARQRIRGSTGQPTYATNRMGCVDTEIDAALRGVRKERRNANRSLASIARSRTS